MQYKRNYNQSPDMTQNNLIIIIIIIIINFLTLRSRVLLEKLVISQVGKKFPAFYGT